MLNKNAKLLILLLVTIISIVVVLFGLEMTIRLGEKIFTTKNYSEPDTVKNMTDMTKLIETVKKNRISKSTFNIYYFGESSMWGEPYVDTIPIMVEKMLGSKVDGKEIKWINFASKGIPFEEVGLRIKEIVDNK